MNELINDEYDVYADNPGKYKCKILKQIRKKIADENDIEYVVEECKFKGKCKGTCPKCDADLMYLEEQLQKRSHDKEYRIKKGIILVGIGAGLMASGCIVSGITNSQSIEPPPQQLTGF